MQGGDIFGARAACLQAGMIYFYILILRLFTDRYIIILLYDLYYNMLCYAYHVTYTCTPLYAC